MLPGSLTDVDPVPAQNAAKSSATISVLDSESLSKRRRVVPSGNPKAVRQNLNGKHQLKQSQQPIIDAARFQPSIACWRSYLASVRNPSSGVRTESMMTPIEPFRRRSGAKGLMLCQAPDLAFGFSPVPSRTPLVPVSHLRDQLSLSVEGSIGTQPRPESCSGVSANGFQQ